MWWALQTFLLPVGTAGHQGRNKHRFNDLWPHFYIFLCKNVSGRNIKKTPVLKQGEPHWKNKMPCEEYQSRSFRNIFQLHLHQYACHTDFKTRIRLHSCSCGSWPMYSKDEPMHTLFSGPLSPIVLQTCFSSLSYSESLSSCSAPQGGTWKDSDESQVQREKLAVLNLWQKAHCRANMLAHSTQKVDLWVQGQSGLHSKTMY